MGNVTIEYNHTKIYERILHNFVGSTADCNKRIVPDYSDTDALFVNSVSGNDGNAGTNSEPFCSLYKAIDAAPGAGKSKIVILNNGYYNDIHSLYGNLPIELPIQLDSTGLQLFARDGIMPEVGMSLGARNNRGTYYNDYQNNHKVYVSASQGTSSGTGTYNNPYTTINQGLNACTGSNGLFIVEVMDSSQYNENIDGYNSGNCSCIQAAAGAMPVINGYVKIKDIYNHEGILDGFTIHDYVEVYGSGGTDTITVINNTIIGENPTPRQILAYTMMISVGLNVKANSNLSALNVYNNKIKHYYIGFGMGGSTEVFNITTLRVYCNSIDYCNELCMLVFPWIGTSSSIGSCIIGYNYFAYSSRDAVYVGYIHSKISAVYFFGNIAAHNVRYGFRFGGTGGSLARFSNNFSYSNNIGFYFTAAFGNIVNCVSSWNSSAGFCATTPMGVTYCAHNDAGINVTFGSGCITATPIICNERLGYLGISNTEQSGSSAVFMEAGHDGELLFTRQALFLVRNSITEINGLYFKAEPRIMQHAIMHYDTTDCDIHIKWCTFTNFGGHAININHPDSTTNQRRIENCLFTHCGGGITIFGNERAGAEIYRCIFDRVQYAVVVFRHSIVNHVTIYGSYIGVHGLGLDYNNVIKNTIIDNCCHYGVKAGLMAIRGALRIFNSFCTARLDDRIYSFNTTNIIENNNSAKSPMLLLPEDIPNHEALWYHVRNTCDSIESCTDSPVCRSCPDGTDAGAYHVSYILTNDTWSSWTPEYNPNIVPARQTLIGSITQETATGSRYIFGHGYKRTLMLQWPGDSEEGMVLTETDRKLLEYFITGVRTNANTITERGTIFRIYPNGTENGMYKNEAVYSLATYYTAAREEYDGFITDPDAAWIENEWVGYYVILTDDANTKHHCRIIKNTATTIYVIDRTAALQTDTHIKKICIAYLRMRIANPEHVLSEGINSLVEQRTGNQVSTDYYLLNTGVTLELVEV